MMPSIQESYGKKVERPTDLGFSVKRHLSKESEFAVRGDGVMR